MTFEVKYRNEKGEVDYISIDADDRTKLFEELRNRKISAIQISDRKGGARYSKPRKAATGGAPLSGKIKGLLALVAVCVIGAVVFMCVSKDEPKPVVEEKKPAKEKRIEVATPEASPKAVVETVVEQKVEEKVEPKGPQKVGEVRDGYVKLPNGELHKRNGLKEIKVSDRARSWHHIFDHYTDNEFAALLAFKPGDSFVGVSIPKDYEKRFLKSLETPIIVSKDDSEEVKQLKQAVIATRLEMKEAYDRGEDIRKIVSDAYAEAARLASYKDDIKTAFKEYVQRPDVSEADIDDFVRAANSLLEEKGIAPIKVGPITRARLRNFKQQ